MAIYKPTKCDLCGYRIEGTDGDTCPNCGTNLVDGPKPEPDITLKVLDKRPVESFKLRLTACDGPGGERLAVLPEPWTKLEQLASFLDQYAAGAGADLQNSLDMLTAAALDTAGKDDPKCSVVNHFLRALGKNLAIHLSSLKDLEHHVRKFIPQFPSSFPQNTLAESIGLVCDGLRAVREDVGGPVGDSLDDLPRWEVNVQPGKPAHALHRSVVVQAPDPLTARMVALNVARERWTDTDFRAISAVPHYSDDAELG